MPIVRLLQCSATSAPKDWCRKNHPLRAIRPLVNAALQRLSLQFDKIYAPGGRDSIAP